MITEFTDQGPRTRKVRGLPRTFLVQGSQVSKFCYHQVRLLFSSKNHTLLYFLGGMMRHKVKCPIDDIANPGCQLLHDPNHLDELTSHVYEEVFENKNESHYIIKIDPANGLLSPEDDLKHLYYYKKNCYEDLEGNIRRQVFQVATPAVPFLAKGTRRRPRMILNSSTGMLQQVEDEVEENRL